MHCEISSINEMQNSTNSITRNSVIQLENDLHNFDVIVRRPCPRVFNQSAATVPFKVQFPVGFQRVGEHGVDMSFRFGRVVVSRRSDETFRVVNGTFARLRNK